jgi:2-polyprenyl-3-methyl-5-hydroxy-6-metoxy-1,4-benzoquinol methylase
MVKCLIVDIIESVFNAETISQHCHPLGNVFVCPIERTVHYIIQQNAVQLYVYILLPTPSLLSVPCV